METLVHPETGQPVDTGSDEPVSEQCQICHMAVSYLRQAIENKETEEEIEEVCLRFPASSLSLPVSTLSHCRHHCHRNQVSTAVSTAPTGIAVVMPGARSHGLFVTGCMSS